MHELFLVKFYDPQLFSNSPPTENFSTPLFFQKNAAVSYLPNYNTKILNSNVMKTVVQYINSIDKANKIHEKLGEYWGVHIVGSCAWDPWVGRDQFTKS